MNVTIPELSGLDHSLGETSKLHLSVRSSAGHLELDVRKWFKFPNLDGFVASKKGILLSLNEWKKVIPLMQRMIEENEG